MWVRAAHRLGLAGGLGFMLVGAVGFATITMTRPVWRHSLTHRIEAVVTILIALALLSYGWAVAVAAIGRRRGWSAVRCYRTAAAPLLIIGGAWAFFGVIRDAEFSAGVLLLATAASTGHMARKLAYPASKFFEPITEAPFVSLRR
jgi:hypothetical protein